MKQRMTLITMIVAALALLAGVSTVQLQADVESDAVALAKCPNAGLECNIDADCINTNLCGCAPTQHECRHRHAIPIE